MCLARGEKRLVNGNVDKSMALRNVSKLKIRLETF